MGGWEGGAASAEKLKEVLEVYEARIAEMDTLLKGMSAELQDCKAAAAAANKDRDNAIQALHKSNSARMNLSEEKKAMEERLAALALEKSSASSADGSAQKEKELESERELVKRLKDRIQTLVNEKKELRADLQKIELEGDAREALIRNELETVKEKSKEFLRKMVDTKKTLQQRISELEDQLQISNETAEQLQQDNTQLRLKRGAAVRYAITSLYLLHFTCFTCY